MTGNLTRACRPKPRISAPTGRHSADVGAHAGSGTLWVGQFIGNRHSLAQGRAVVFQAVIIEPGKIIQDKTTITQSRKESVNRNLCVFAALREIFCDRRGRAPRPILQPLTCAA